MGSFRFPVMNHQEGDIGLFLFLGLDLPGFFERRRRCEEWFSDTSGLLFLCWRIERRLEKLPSCGTGLPARDAPIRTIVRHLELAPLLHQRSDFTLAGDTATHTYGGNTAQPEPVTASRSRYRHDNEVGLRRNHFHMARSEAPGAD